MIPPKPHFYTVELVEEPSELIAGDLPIAYIRTSDRSAFKRCRRKWGFQSGLKQNLDLRDRPIYFWIGSACHFALEDYHGYNFYGSPIDALGAYVEAQKQFSRANKLKMPDGYEEQVAIGEGILTHYLQWVQNRGCYDTLWIDGEPQVEVRCTVELNIPKEYLNYCGYSKAFYQGTLDRVAVIDGQIWVQDWKFYKSISDMPHLDFDPQMGAYIWLGNAVYQQPIEGAILQQFRKDLPNQPRILKNGTISAAQNQKTTHSLYRDALIKMYGNVNKAPPANITLLDEMAAQEGHDRDDFIRRDRTRRTQNQQESEGTKILMEVMDMINPDIAMYPNPTRDCSWDCQLQDVCLMMDRDDYWQDVLEELTAQRTADSDDWRDYLPT